MKTFLIVTACVVIVYLIWGLEGVLWVYAINYPIMIIALILLGIARMFND